MEKRKAQNGQMLLVVVLVMIVVLTVGLSLVSRAIINQKMSKQNEESQRAFQAAEAGIELAIKNIASPNSVDLGNNANFTTSIKEAIGTQLVLNGGNEVDQDKGMDVMLSDNDDFSTSKNYSSLNVYWWTGATTNCDDIPALEILLLTGTKSSPSLTKKIIDPCSRIPNSESVSVGSYTIDEITFKYSYPLGAISIGLIAKVVPIYNSAKIALVSDPALPSQGKLIVSVGKSGDTTRKIQYFVSKSQIPAEFFYGIISQDND